MTPYIRALRPRQWSKNLIVYFPLVFTMADRLAPGQPADLIEPLGLATAAFLLFSVLSSAAYLVNDLLDAPQDRVHPRKRSRPIASGQVRPGAAIGAAVILAIVGVSLSWVVRPWVGGVALAYLLLTLAYSFGLKHVAIIDVLTLSGGYVLRAVAGAVVIQVPASPWLYVVTGLGATLIGFGKRRNELVLAGADGSAGLQRQALEGYSVGLLDQLVAVVTPATLVSYILYTFTAEGLPENHTMMLTIPLVAYGLFRYLLLVYQRNVGEAPEDVLLTDGPTLVTVGLWLGAVVAILLAWG